MSCSRPSWRKQASSQRVAAAVLREIKPPSGGFFIGRSQIDSCWRLLRLGFRPIWCLLFVWLLLAAYRAAATYFSCLHKKSKQKKCTLLPVSLWALLRKSQAGNLRCSIPGRGRRTHCAPASLRSNSCGQFDDDAVTSCGATAHPVTCAPRHGWEGVTSRMTLHKSIVTSKNKPLLIN